MSSTFRELDILSEKEKTKILYDSYIQMRSNWEFITQLSIIIQQSPYNAQIPNLINIFSDLCFTSNLMIPWYRIYQVLRNMNLIKQNPPFSFWEDLNLYYESLRHPAHKIHVINFNNSFELMIMDCWFLNDIIPKLKFWNEFCDKKTMFLLQNVEIKADKLYKEWKNKNKHEPL